MPDSDSKCCNDFHEPKGQCHDDAATAQPAGGIEQTAGKPEVFSKLSIWPLYGN